MEGFQGNNFGNPGNSTCTFWECEKGGVESFLVTIE